MRHTLAAAGLLSFAFVGTSFGSQPPIRMRARMSMILLAAFTATAAAETPQACWAPADLAHHSGEERVQRGVRQAHVPAPARTLAEYSPLSQHGPIRRVKLPPGVKLVALTFDMCEQPFEISGYQGALVDVLRQNHVKATFFLGGKWMLTHRARTQQLMSDPSFEVANHTWEHRNLRTLSGLALIDEIRNAQLAYEQVREELQNRQCTRPGEAAIAGEAAPTRLGLIRFPYGACGAAALSEVAQQGLRPIQWDVSSGDPTFTVSARMIEQQVLANVRPGSIVLFHANGRGWHTEGALPAIIAALKARGYGFATVSELIAAGEPEVASSCYDSHPGDSDRWQPLRPRAPSPFAGGSLFGSRWSSAAPHPRTR
jgi:peptidoglycan-N-acetylglucosamine deacetylase